MKVLSLFDGMSCGQIALERVGIKVDKYYASEINPYSIKITQKNYPGTIQLGDVRNIHTKQLAKIDLLIGGSPCQNLSITAIDREEVANGLKGSKSSLFFEYVKLLKELKPRYFLLENVASMTNENRDIMSEFMGVEPIFIDSNLVTAQDRARYYWTNIPNIQQPQALNICLKDIMQPNVDEKYFYDRPFTFNGWDKKIIATLDLKGHEQMKRVYNPLMTCGTLTACRGGNLQKKVYENGRCRKLTPTEYEILQTVPIGYTEGVSESQRYNMLGDGWTVDVIAHIFANMEMQKIENAV